MADKSPRDVAVEVMKSVKAEIRAYEEGLVKMRAAEVGALKKSLFGLPQQAESNKQIVAKIHKPAKTVFDILGKSEGSKVDPNTRANGSKRPDIKCKKCGQTKPWSESGANQCNDCFDKQVAASKESAKKSEEFIDTKEDADPSKRYVHVGAYDNKAVPEEALSSAWLRRQKLEKDALDAGTKAVKPPAAHGPEAGRGARDDG